MSEMEGGNEIVKRQRNPPLEFLMSVMVFKEGEKKKEKKMGNQNNNNSKIFPKGPRRAERERKAKNIRKRKK